MKQRLGIAAALLNDPQLLLLDEPANGLDPAGIVGMRDSLRALAAAGKTVFVSSHILSEVQQLADVVGIIAHGRLVREGSVETLLREEGSVRIRVAADEVPAAAGVLDAASPGAGTVSPEGGPEGGWLAVKVDPARSAELNRALAGAGVFASRIEGGANLESPVPRADRVAARPRRRAGPPGGPDRGAAAHDLGQRPGREARDDRVVVMRLFVANLRKLVRRPATWVTFLLFVALLGLIYLALIASAQQASATRRRRSRRGCS